MSQNHILEVLISHFHNKTEGKRSWFIHILLVETHLIKQCDGETKITHKWYWSSSNLVKKKKKRKKNWAIHLSMIFASSIDCKIVLSNYSSKLIILTRSSDITKDTTAPFTIIIRFSITINWFCIYQGISKGRPYPDCNA